jgi:hypothetical protein
MPVHVHVSTGRCPWRVSPKTPCGPHQTNCCSWSSQGWEQQCTQRCGHCGQVHSCSPKAVHLKSAPSLKATTMSADSQSVMHAPRPFLCLPCVAVPCVVSLPIKQYFHAQHTDQTSPNPSNALLPHRRLKLIAAGCWPQACLARPGLLPYPQSAGRHLSLVLSFLNRMTRRRQVLMQPR